MAMRQNRRIEFDPRLVRLQVRKDARSLAGHRPHLSGQALRTGCSLRPVDGEVT